MKKIKTTVALCALAMTLNVSAAAPGAGAPHTVEGTSLFDKVSLSWKSPGDEMTLAWHDGKDYNGMSGRLVSPDGACVIYAAASFQPADLQPFAGRSIKAVRVYEYRNPISLTLQIYVDNKLAYEQPVKRNWARGWTEVALEKPFILPEGKEVKVAFRFEHGRNVDFVANTDREPSQGKGDIYSYDGKTWKSGANGDFLITAVLDNPSTLAPDKYLVYCDGKSAGETAETAITLAQQTKGTHTYTVAALYGTDELKSNAISLGVRPADTHAIPPSTASGSVDVLKGTINWTAPLAYAPALSWSGNDIGNNIGGTASSNTKVWVKHEFSAFDLLAYANHKITGVQAYIAEKIISGATIFVMKDNALVYSLPLTAEQLEAITAPAWNSFPIPEADAITIEPGHSYAYGIYYLHTPKGHPVGVDKTAAIDVKANSFSTSSPNSTNFLNSKPSWKTLAQGEIAGNFMLRASVKAPEGYSFGNTTASYKISSEGNVLATIDASKSSYSEEVDKLGSKSYTITAIDNKGNESEPLAVTLTYNLPEEYTAPIITSTKLNEETGTLHLEWIDKAADLKYYGTAAYTAGFSEDMGTTMWGVKFPAASLTDYVGYSINSMSFGIGCELDSFKVMILADKEVLYSETFKKGDVQAAALYNLNIDKDIRIPAGKDLYLAYMADLKASQSAMILDKGPLKPNGALVSLNNGTKWLELSKVEDLYDNYNIVIGALAMPASAAAPETDKAVALTNEGEIFAAPAGKIILNSETLRNYDREGYGVEATIAPIAKAPAAKATAKTKSFKVLRNYEVVDETTANKSDQKIPGYGAFDFNVITVFENGWESPASKTIRVTNPIPAAPAAPYGLSGTVEGSKLNLSWSAPYTEKSCKKYHSGDKSLGYGLTMSGTVEGYHAIKFPVDSLKDNVGGKLTHIRFQLYTNEGLEYVSVFVVVDENIVYEQGVNLEDLATALTWNEIRLNTPYTIPEGKEVGFGYHLKYPNGVKPWLVDDNPAIPGYSDIVSSSGSAGYWYSLKTKFKIDKNYRMEGVFEAPAAMARTRAFAPATDGYKVYRNGEAIAEGIAENSFSIANASNGTYAVTLVRNSVESAPSNELQVSNLSGVEDVTVDGNAPAVYYNLQGIKVEKAESGSIYIKREGQKATKTLVK